MGGTRRGPGRDGTGINTGSGTVDATDGGNGRWKEGGGEAEAGVIIVSLLTNLEVSGAHVDGSHSGSFMRMQSGGGWAWVFSKVPPTAVRYLSREDQVLQRGLEQVGSLAPHHLLSSLPMRFEG